MFFSWGREYILAEVSQLPAFGDDARSGGLREIFAVSAAIAR
jgi:hypothetical protein